MPSAFPYSKPVMVLAGTCYGEARGGGKLGMADVASVAMNRMHAGWSGGTLVGVCLAPYQFSCWGITDPNRDQIIAAASAGTDPAWLEAVLVAEASIAEAVADMTGGADSYYAISMSQPPFWAKPPAVHTITRWEHSFWRVRPSRPVPVSSAHAPLPGDQTIPES